MMIVQLLPATFKAGGIWYYPRASKDTFTRSPIAPGLAKKLTPDLILFHVA